MKQKQNMKQDEGLLYLGLYAYVFNLWKEWKFK